MFLRRTIIKLIVALGCNSLLLFLHLFSSLSIHLLFHTSILHAVSSFPSTSRPTLPHRTPILYRQSFNTRLVALRARASAFGPLPSNSSRTPVTCYKQVSPLFCLPLFILPHSFFFLPSPSSFAPPLSPVPSSRLSPNSAEFFLPLGIIHLALSTITTHHYEKVSNCSLIQIAHAFNV